jgi:hypothetical protein
MAGRSLEEEGASQVRKVRARSGRCDLGWEGTTKTMVRKARLREPQGGNDRENHKEGRSDMASVMRKAQLRAPIRKVRARVG